MYSILPHRTYLSIADVPVTPIMVGVPVSGDLLFHQLRKDSGQLIEAYRKSVKGRASDRLLDNFRKSRFATENSQEVVEMFR